MDLLGSTVWLRLLLKAIFGGALFTLILWCAQSRNPRAAGMMLTFPALNGIGLLTTETDDLFLMVQAMPPMIVLNGLLCTGYLLVQGWRLRQGTPGATLGQPLGLLGLGLLIWGSMAFWIAPALQPYLSSSRQMLAFVGAYAGCCVALTALGLWCPSTVQQPARLSFGRVLQINAVRISGMLACIVLVMLVAHYGAAAWAGRLSTLPILPFYSLLMLSVAAPHPPQGRARLAQIGSTTLWGPLVAIAFVWAFTAYLQAIRTTEASVATTVLAVLGLLGLWGLSGLLIWGLLYVVQRLESSTAMLGTRHVPR